MPLGYKRKPWEIPEQSKDDYESARRTYTLTDKSTSPRTSDSKSFFERFLGLLFIACVICGVISLILAPFTGITVVTAAAFFVCAWFLHKLLGGI